MATILRGKRAGDTVELDQWCNTWVATDDGLVLSVTNIQLTSAEVARIRTSSDNGIMFDLFDLGDDGLFTEKLSMHEWRAQRLRGLAGS